MRLKSWHKIETMIKLSPLITLSTKKGGIPVRKVVCALACFVLLFCCFNVFAETTTTFIVDTPSGVNIRDAKKGGEVVGGLRNGTRFEVIDYSDKYWVTIRREDGSLGYVYKEYVRPANPDEIIEQPPKQSTRTPIDNHDAYLLAVVVKDATVYKKVDGNKLGKMLVGETVYVRQTGKYWYKIVWNNCEIGYIQKERIKLVDANIPGTEHAYVLSDGGEQDSRAAIRETPSADARVIKVLNMRSFVRVIEDLGNGWVKVRYDAYGNEGYMYKKWLRETTLFSQDWFVLNSHPHAN